MYDVPTGIQEYIDLFQQEAEMRGIDLVVDDLVVVYMSDLSLDGVGAAGLCYSETEEAAPTIHLDTLSDNWTAGPYTREALVFHELGHCVLGRGHTSELLLNSNYKSIMKPSGDPIYNSFTLYKREYYIDELFDENTPPPAWSLPSLLAYDEYSEDDKTYIFEENFDNNDRDWGTTWLGSNGQMTGEISGGFYTMTNNDDDTSYSDRKDTGLDASNTDWEIEMSFKIVEGNTFVNGLYWGGENSPNGTEWQYSLNDFGDGLIGTFLDNEYVSNPYNSFDNNAFNKLTVRKVGDDYFFYCNESLTDSFPFIDFNATNVGFIVTIESEIQIDYLKVATL